MVAGHVNVPRGGQGLEVWLHESLATTDHVNIFGAEKLNVSITHYKQNDFIDRQD